MRIKSNLILISICSFITLLLLGCNSGYSDSNHYNNESNIVDHSIVETKMSSQELGKETQRLAKNDITDINQLYQQYAVPKKTSNTSEHTYYGYSNDKTDSTIKGRINFVNLASNFSQYQLKKFVILLNLYIINHPNSTMIKFKHILLDEYQKLSSSQRELYKRVGYRDILVIQSGGGITSPHQYFNNQITIYFKQGTSLVKIKQELLDLDQFLYKYEPSKELIDVDADIKLGFYTSYRNDFITKDGKMNFSNLTETQQKQFVQHTNQFLNKKFGSSFVNLDKIYDVVKTYDELNENIEEELLDLWKWLYVY